MCIPYCTPCQIVNLHEWLTAAYVQVILYITSVLPPGYTPSSCSIIEGGALTCTTSLHMSGMYIILYGVPGIEGTCSFLLSRCSGQLQLVYVHVCHTSIHEHIIHVHVGRGSSDFHACIRAKVGWGVLQYKMALTV